MDTRRETTPATVATQSLPPIVESILGLHPPLPVDGQADADLDNDSTRSESGKFELTTFGRALFNSRTASDVSSRSLSIEINENPIKPSHTTSLEEHKGHVEQELNDEENYPSRNSTANASPAVSSRHSSSADLSLSLPESAKLIPVESEELVALRASVKAIIQQIDASKEHMEWLEIVLGPNVSANNKFSDNIFKRIENNNERELYKFFNTFFIYQKKQFREKYILAEYLKYIETEQAKVISKHERQLNELLKKQAKANNKKNDYPIMQSRKTIELTKEILAYTDKLSVNPGAYSAEQLHSFRSKLSPSIDSLERSLNSADTSGVAAVAEMHKQVSQKEHEVAASKLYWENETRVCQQLMDCYRDAYQNHHAEITKNQSDPTKTRETLTAYSTADSLKKHQRMMTRFVAGSSWKTVPFRVMVNHSLHTSETKLFDHHYIAENQKTTNFRSANELLGRYTKILKIPAALEVCVSADEADHLYTILDNHKGAIIKSIVKSSYDLAYSQLLKPFTKASTSHGAAEEHQAIEQAKKHHEEHLTRRWNKLLNTKRWKTCIGEGDSSKINLMILKSLFYPAKKISLDTVVEAATEEGRLRYKATTIQWLKNKSNWLNSHANLIPIPILKKASPEDCVQAFIDAQGPGSIHALFKKGNSKGAELVSVAFDLYIKAPEEKKSYFIKVLSILFQHGAALPVHFIGNLDNHPSTKHWQLIAEYLTIVPMYSPLAAKLTEQLAIYVKEIDNTLNSFLYWPSRLFMSVSAMLMNHSHLLYVAGVTLALQDAGTNNEEIYAKLDEIIHSQDINVIGSPKNSKLKEIAIETKKQLESKVLLAFPQFDAMKVRKIAEKKKDPETLEQVMKELRQTRAEHAAMQDELHQNNIKFAKEQRKAKAESDAKHAETRAEFEVKHAETRAEFEARQAEAQAEFEAKQAETRAEFEARQAEGQVVFKVQLAEAAEAAAKAVEARFEELIARRLASGNLATVPAKAPGGSHVIPLASSSPRLFQPAPAQAEAISAPKSGQLKVIIA